MPHRILLGNKPLFEYYYDYGPREGDTLWSPADWAWIAGLINILLVGLVLRLQSRLNRHGGL